MTAFARRLGRWALILVLSVAGSYASAAVFITVLSWTVPPSDHAYGRGLDAAFSDPFVMAVALWWATIAGLIVFPIALWALRDRSLLVGFGVCLAAAVAAVAAVTPFGGWLGIVAGLAAAGLALSWSRRSLPQARGLGASGS